ncbi:MAG: SdrD B-like domain-containing protein [Solirubrobacteraceae bacterium]
MSPRKTLILLVLIAAAVVAPAAAAGPAARISQAAGSVSGTVFNDTNTNGIRDAGEDGLAGWTVYVDLHGSGALAADDPSGVTGADGSYSIAGVPSGTFIIGIVQQAGFSCTMLGGCIYQQTFPVALTGADFGEHAGTGPPPPPTVTPPALGKSFTAGVVSGVVFIKLSTGTRAATKGTGFVALTEPRSLPVGSTLDTRAGVIRVTTAVNSTGGTQTGNFGGATFKLLQDRSQKGLTQLNLVLGRATSACPKVGKARTAAAKKLLPKSVLALLHANAKGKFRTRGRFSSATVRGTMWDTADRCDGTLTTVQRGLVAVQDLRRRRTVLVSAGHAYLARR